MSVGARNSITDVPGLMVGQAQDRAVKTGVTVILPDAPAIAAVDVRGGGPGTREADALALTGLVDRADAIVLAGGSVYGLGAADRIAALLGARGRGFSLMPAAGVPVSPIVPAAILYDLANGGDKEWGDQPPYGRLGAEALDAVSEEVALGPVGAGCGALAGQHLGGLGTASAVTDAGVTVGAIAAVNSFGSPYVPGTRQFWAAPFEVGDEFGGRGIAQAAVSGFPSDTKVGSGPRGNTTIACIATDADLSKAEAARLAIMAQDGLARALRPAHGPTDGDTVFVLATGGRPLAEPRVLGLTELGNLAADVLARAIARGVYFAEA
ncbi:P1 family peptidase [Parvularcula sp. LCG005]|uniref:P1 family peptidase n=1 Tax=Parvularcula sp. LCG005 TaxID=3078805 RepID=UPI002942B7FF|nr:P1 family peptidase [Parvularcula sp. LCG005]WOI54034.1 P1 family peptidase [Parvularcula sp. LCG005]